MKPQVLLRAAAALTLAHALLNSFAGLLSGTSKNQEEASLLTAMKSLHFDAMGSLRTYWDFYFGFGLFLTVNLLLLSALMWRLAALVKEEPAMARPFVGLLCIFLAFAVLSPGARLCLFTTMTRGSNEQVQSKASTPDQNG